MMRMMVLLMMTMMILMMPGAMTVTVVTISPLREGISPAESPRQEGVSSLCRLHREEVAEKFYEVAPR